MMDPNRFTYLVRAKIKWLGRSRNPNKPLPKDFVSMPAHFDAQSQEEKFELRQSLVLRLPDPWDADKTTIADVGFLVPDAPKEWLQPGSRFGLWDGQIVAEGEVLSYLSDSRE